MSRKFNFAYLSVTITISQHFISQYDCRILNERTRKLYPGMRMRDTEQIK